MGLLAEIRAFFTRGDSGGEIVLVRFDRLRTRWKSAGRREDFAEALPRDVRHGGLVRWRGRGYWQRHRVCLRLQNEPRRCRVFEWPHDSRDGLQRHLLESGPMS